MAANFTNRLRRSDLSFKSRLGVNSLKTKVKLRQKGQEEMKWCSALFIFNISSFERKLRKRSYLCFKIRLIANSFKTKVKLWQKGQGLMRWRSAAFPLFIFNISGFGSRLRNCSSAIFGLISAKLRRNPQML